MSGVADALGVSTKSIPRWHNNYKVHGCINTPSALHGRHRIVTGEVIDELRRLIQESPELYLDTISSTCSAASAASAGRRAFFLAFFIFFRARRASSFSSSKSVQELENLRRPLASVKTTATDIERYLLTRYIIQCIVKSEMYLKFLWPPSCCFKTISVHAMYC